MKKNLKRFFLILVGCGLFYAAIPELLHQNKGKSASRGSVGKGKLENSYLLPYFGENFSYFSPLSYFVLNNGYTHERVYQTLLTAYQTCRQTSPETHFRLMECSKKEGGKMLIHRTHQNGLSVDFMTPLKPSGSFLGVCTNYLGMWHYLLEFDKNGRWKLDPKVEIDFDTMGKHILALDDAAKKHGLRIQKVIFMLELKDDFFNSPYGKQVKQRGIYFAQNLSPFINSVHDDHYHVDFAFL